MYRVHPCFLVSQQTALITKVSGRGSIKILDPFYSGSCLRWGLVAVTFACCGEEERQIITLWEKKQKTKRRDFFCPLSSWQEMERGLSSLHLSLHSKFLLELEGFFFFLDHYNWTGNVLAASDCYNK